jgi:hypothetical protein
MLLQATSKITEVFGELIWIGGSGVGGGGLTLAAGGSGVGHGRSAFWGMSARWRACTASSSQPRHNRWKSDVQVIPDFLILTGTHLTQGARRRRDRTTYRTPKRPCSPPGASWSAISIGSVSPLATRSSARSPGSCEVYNTNACRALRPQIGRAAACTAVRLRGIQPACPPRWASGRSGAGRRRTLRRPVARHPHRVRKSVIMCHPARSTPAALPPQHLPNREPIFW